MLYAHSGHRADRAAPQAHRATWPIVAEVGRGWHRAVIRGDARKSTPGPTRRALLSPHPKREGKLQGGSGWKQGVGRGRGGSARSAEKGCRPPPLAPVCFSSRLSVRARVSAGSSALTLRRRNSPFRCRAEHEPALTSGSPFPRHKNLDTARGSVGWVGDSVELNDAKSPNSCAHAALPCPVPAD